MSIKLSPEQQEIFDAVMASATSPTGQNMIISGAGGTGKTTLICELILEMIRQGMKVCVMAMTGQATDVLRGKINLAFENAGIELPPVEQLKIETIAKVTKKAIPIGISSKSQTRFINHWRDPMNFGYDVLFVDELSMVDALIGDWWRLGGIKVFGFGDKCQLPEVNGQDTSQRIEDFKNDLHIPNPYWRTGYGIACLTSAAQFEMTKVLRSTNDIAHLCNRLRDFAKPKQWMLEQIQQFAQTSPVIEYSTNIGDLHTEDDWQIICYTNKMCDALNQHLCFGQGYPTVLDKVLVCDNLNPMHIYNGNTMRFGEFLQRIADYNKEAAAAKIDPRTGRRKQKIYVVVKWEGRMPSLSSRHPQEQTFAKTYAMFKSEFERTNRARLDDLPTILRQCGRPPSVVDEWLSIISKFAEHNTDPSDIYIKFVDYLARTDKFVADFVIMHSKELPQVQFVTLKYGYAITTHKAQGSEYDKCAVIIERFDKPLVYTGLTRAKQYLQVIEFHPAGYLDIKGVKKCTQDCTTTQSTAT